MIDVFFERRFDPPLTDGDLAAMGEDSAMCFKLYRVVWQGSLLSADRRRLLCHFKGPDAESVRMAMRRNDGPPQLLWPGTVHDAPDVDDEALARANVVVLRRFEKPVELASIQAIEDRGIDCLRVRNVRFVRSCFATDRKRMACLYSGPDAESVRMAQEQARMPVEAVWAFQRVAP